MRKVAVQYGNIEAKIHFQEFFKTIKVVFIT